MLGNITATVLFVQDLDKCMTFYEDTFGLKDPYTDDVSAAYRIGGHDFVLLKASPATAMVGEEPLALDKGAPRVLLCVGVEDVDATYKELTA